MRNNDFNRLDQHIKAAMERLKPEYDPSSWDMLEQKMDALSSGVDDNGADAMDQILANKLSSMGGVPAPNWSLFEEKLEFFPHS